MSSENSGSLNSTKNLEKKLTNDTLVEELLIEVSGGVAGKTFATPDDILAEAVLQGYAGTEDSVSFMKAYSSSSNTVANPFTVATAGLPAVTFVEGESYSVGNETKDAGGDVVALGSISVVVAPTAVVKFYINVFTA